MSWLRVIGGLGCLSWGLIAAAPVTPPPPPSPIAFFRELLAAEPEGRAQALSSRSESQRQAINAKLREYEAMPPAARESRLRATEFRWYLRPLLTQPADNRPAQLAGVPPEYREMIGRRLDRWDALTSAVREELLAYDRAVSWLARAQLNRPRDPLPAAPFPPSGDAQLDASLRHWQGFSEERRDELCRSFEAFFELSDPEQRRTLAKLSDAERVQVEATLAEFARLPAAHRSLCVRSFRKFARLTPAERAQFLQSADRWREMTVEEREEWRNLVSELPPLPPGFETPPPLPPPLPPVLASQP